MKTNKITKIILTLVFFLSVSGMFAQLPVDPDPDPDPVDGPLDPLPIAAYLIPMFILGVATAFILLRKKTATKM